MIGILLNMGRHTVSRAIDTIGHAQQDWSAVYRLFERERVDLEYIQQVIRRYIQAANAPGEPVIAFTVFCRRRWLYLKKHRKQF